MPRTWSGAVSGDVSGAFSESNNDPRQKSGASPGHFLGATLFGQLKIGQLFFGQLNSASYFMEIRLDIGGLKI